MKIVKNDSTRKRIAVVLGVLLAFTILTTQSFAYYFQTATHVAVSEIQDQDADTPSPQFLSQDAVAVPAIQLNIAKPFQVVFEFFLSEDNDSHAEPGSVPLNFEFFKNLFRLVISPNAP